MSVIMMSTKMIICPDPLRFVKGGIQNNFCAILHQNVAIFQFV